MQTSAGTFSQGWGRGSSLTRTPSPPLLVPCIHESEGTKGCRFSACTAADTNTLKDEHCFGVRVLWLWDALRTRAFVLGLGMDAVVFECIWNTNRSTVWAWMLWLSDALEPVALGGKSVVEDAVKIKSKCGFTWGLQGSTPPKTPNPKP